MAGREINGMALASNTFAKGFVLQLIGLGESSTAFRVILYFAGIAAVALALWQLSRSNEGAAFGWLAKVFTTRTRIALCVGMVVLVRGLGAAVGFGRHW